MKLFTVLYSILRVNFLTWFFVITLFSVIVVPVRLSNGHSRTSGRVDMFINGQWGTVCDDHWGTRSSTVLCRQLGLGNTGRFNRYTVGPSSYPIFLDDVNCIGTEANILACPHLRLGSHNCGHAEDTGVICSGLYSSYMYSNVL